MTLPNIFTTTTTKGFMYDFSALSGNPGDQVSSVSDLSGNGNHVSQSVSAKQPKIISVSGKKGIKFDKIDDFLTASGVDLSGCTSATLIVACKYTGTTTDYIMEHGTALGGGFGAYVNNGTSAMGSGMGLNNFNHCFYNANINSAGNPTVFTAIYKPSATPRINIRLDGADNAEVMVAGAGTVTNAIFGNRTLYIGAYQGGASYSNMELYGMICAGRDLTPTELADCETWALSLLPPAINNTRKYFKYENTTYTTQQSGYVETCPFAQVSFVTDAQNVEIDSYTNIYSNYPTLATLGIFVDDVYTDTIQHTAFGNKTTSLTLSPGTKKLTIVNGAQSKPSTSVLGTFFKAIRADAPFLTPPNGEKLVIYGDSIAVGANATDAIQYGWPMVVGQEIDTTVEAYGFRCLADDAVSIADFSDKLAAMAPTKIWLAIGTNDYGLSHMTAPVFQANYAELLEKLHKLCPTATIYAQTPLLRSSEAANSLGYTLGAYRTAIQNAASGKLYVTVVDGTAILSLSDLDDGVHPTTSGHGKYATYAKTAMGI